MTILASYIHKTECVTAVRLNEHNIEEIASLIGGELWKDSDGRAKQTNKPMPHIMISPRVRAGIGDWVAMQGNKVKFYSDEKFQLRYHSLAEALSESDRLAMVHKIIDDAMADGVNSSLGLEDTDWDVIAMLAAKHILSIT
jgi:hypothetical protein